MIILDSNTFFLNKLSTIAFSTLLLFSCTDNKEDKIKKQNREIKKDLIIVCTDSFCSLNYSGPEFTIQKGEIIDTAHRMSNLISGEVGKKLKSLFEKKKIR